LLRCGSE